MGHRVECPNCGSRFYVHAGQNVVQCRKKYRGCGNHFNAHTNVVVD